MPECDTMGSVYDNNDAMNLLKITYVQYYCNIDIGQSEYDDLRS